MKTGEAHLLAVMDDHSDPRATLARLVSAAGLAAPAGAATELLTFSRYRN